MTAITLVTLAGVAFTCPARTPGAHPEPSGFSVSPSGSEVSRLEPIRVTYPVRPAREASAALLSLQPPIPGEYAWIGERTLQFQPAFPGLLRGQDYTIHVAAIREAGIRNDYTQSFTTAGRLVVEQVIPQDNDAEIPLDAQIMVQFNRAVAPLTTLQEQPTAALLLSDPPLTGKGEWLNTALYRFVPDNLRPYSEYELRVPAGLTAQTDGVIDRDYTWSFRTVSPEVAAVSPHAGATGAGPNQRVVVTFTQPMEQSAAEAGIAVSEAELATGADAERRGGRPLVGTYSWNDEGTEVTFSAGGGLTLGAKYQVRVERGLTGVSGGHTRNDWRSAFSVVGPPTVVHTQPANHARDAARFGVRIEFSNPMDRDSVEDRVSVSGIDQTNLRMYWGRDQSLTLGVGLKPSSEYTVAIAEGTVDRYGLALPPYTFTFTTGRVEPSLGLVTAGPAATYSSTTEPVLYYRATNVGSVGLTLYPLTAIEVRQIWAGKGNRDFTPSQPVVRSWVDHPSGELDASITASTSLSGDGPLPLGDYYVTAGIDGAQRPSISFAFSVVNSTLVSKQSNDQLLVWALDHDTGAPLDGVELHLEGRVAQEQTQLTDENGVAIFPYQPHPDPFRGDPIVVTLESATHRGVVFGGRSYGMQPWHSEVITDYGTREYVGYIYTDRPIYRPGEEVHYKAVIRADDDVNYTVPEGTRFELSIPDAGRKELRRETVAVNEFGTLGGTFSIPTDAPVGDYHLTISDGALRRTSPKFVATASFQVAEFRKPEFQVEMQSEQPSYADGDSIGLVGHASFYFGGPVAGVPVKWSVLASPFTLRSASFPHYSFGDEDSYRRSVANSKSPSGEGTSVTDLLGRVAYSLPATITGNEGAQLYRISTTVTDENAQAVSVSSSVNVHAASLYAGVRPRSNLAIAGREMAIDLATVDMEGVPLPGTPVTVRVYERTWITTKEQTPDGARRYRSDPQDTLIATLQAITDEDARASVGYTPRVPGTLRLVAAATDLQGRMSRSSTSAWVTGIEYAPWPMTNNDALPLVADKDEYHVGDVAEILVPAPYVGMHGLVTVERGRILSHETASFAGNSDRIRVPILPDHIPNIYVSVVLYRGPIDGDPIPRYKVGYVKLTVSTETRQLLVDVRADRSQTRPGETVGYAIKVTDLAGRPVQAELSLAMVDKALFALAEERTPTGLRAFWFERGLGVGTGSSAGSSMDRLNNTIVELGSQGNKGGGGLADERLRQEFRNTAYWEAQVTTDDNGEVSVQVKVPDNATTWRMQARAIDAGAMVGEGSSELISTEPLLIRPALPRFLRVGDEVSLRALVRNNTNTSMRVQVDLAATGIELVHEDAHRDTEIPAAGSRSIEWAARARTDGEGSLTFRATGDGFHDAIVQRLVVHPSITQETTATGGVVTRESRTETVYLPPYATQQGGKLQVAVQPSLVGPLENELAAMQPRPWESNLAIAGRLIATAGVRRAAPLISAEGQLGSDTALNRDVTALTSAQRSDGGWSWCSSTCGSEPNITGWVLLALGEARRDGRTLPSGLVERAATYLQSHLNRRTDVNDPESPDERAFLLYALAAADAPQTSMVTALEEQARARMAPWGKAYLALALLEQGVNPEDPRLRTVLGDLNAAVIPSANGNHWEGGNGSRAFHTSRSTTGLVLSALVRAQPDHPLIEETVRWMMVARGIDGWGAPVERAQVIVALSEYLAHTQELQGNYAYRVQLNGAELFGGRFDAGRKTPPRREDLALGLLTLGRQNLIAFVRELGQPGRLYYTIALRYMTPSRDIEALNRGIAVSRTYTRLDDPSTPIDTVELGETVRVKLTVMNQRDLKYVEVDDLLPGGLEAMDPKLRITDKATIARLEAERSKNGPIQTGGRIRAPWYRGYYSPWHQVQIRDDRVTLSAATLTPGVSEYIYYARATAVGAFTVPPVRAEETHFPEVFGRSDSATFTVAP